MHIEAFARALGAAFGGLNLITVAGITKARGPCPESPASLTLSASRPRSRPDRGESSNFTRPTCSAWWKGRCFRGRPRPVDLRGLSHRAEQGVSLQTFRIRGERPPFDRVEVQLSGGRRRSGAPPQADGHGRSLPGGRRSGGDGQSGDRRLSGRPRSLPGTNPGHPQRGGHRRVSRSVLASGKTVRVRSSSTRGRCLPGSGGPAGDRGGWRLLNRDVATTLVLAGPGTAGGRRERALRELCWELGVSEAVRFTGPLDQASLARLHHECDVILAPLTANDRNLVQGCCPLKILEAMASSTPLVASDLPVVRELAQRPEVDAPARPGPASAKSIKDAVPALVADPTLGRRLSNSAREAVKSAARADLVPRPGEPGGRVRGGPGDRLVPRSIDRRSISRKIGIEL